MSNKIPNLDAISREELMNFWNKYQNRTRRNEAAELIGDRRIGYTTIAKNLGAYAANKAAAISCRWRGDIQGAEVYEGICERIYKNLPDDLKW